MTDKRDMTAPITRGELHEALEIWAGAIVEQVIRQLSPKFEAIDTRFEAIDTKFEAIDTRFEAIDARFEAIDAKFDAKFDDIHGRLVLVESRISDIPALIKNTEETILDAVKRTLDEHRTLPARVVKIEDAALPERVGKLEAKVFAPKRRASKTTRRRS